MAKRKRKLKLERFDGREFMPYARSIGQAVMAWNDLHTRLAFLFETVIGRPIHNVAYAIWHSSTSDRACREMLKAVLYEVGLRWPQGYPEATDDIKWILDRAQSLEDTRNDIIHSPLMMIGHKKTAGGLASLAAPFHKPAIIPQSFLGHKRALKLEDKPDLLSEIQWCRDAALMLRDFTAEVQRALRDTERNPTWPQRPALPPRRLKSAPRPRQTRKG